MDTKDAPDISLRTKALRRARHGDVPRTLTPWEWEEWYAVHGVPPAHREAPDPPPAGACGAPRGLLARLLCRLRGGAPK